MRLISLATGFLLLSLTAHSQNFEPTPGPLKDKLENALKRYGTIEQIFPDNPAKKTFTGKPGKEYFAWVVYDRESTAVRRMMIIQQGPGGEKVKIHYPRFNQAINDANNQAFAISFIAPEESSPLVYRVDASPESTVYLYEITRGFKRDMNTRN